MEFLSLLNQEVSIFTDMSLLLVTLEALLGTMTYLLAYNK